MFKYDHKQKGDIWKGDSENLIFRPVHDIWNRLHIDFYNI